MRFAAWVALSALVASAPGHAVAQSSAREPLDVARVLAGRYPAAPSMSYIPALAWAGAYRLAGLTGEPAWLEKPRREMRPFVEGTQPAVGERPSLTALAGHLAFWDAGAADDDPAATALARLAADLMVPDSAGAVVRFATGWTDDMFMATSVWARVGYADAAGRLLLAYIERLQRPDGLFIHAETGAHAWGRGNGFAALGMTEALMRFPESWRERPRVLEAYQRQMLALLAHQTEDGSWRQVIDQPTAYQELSVTALMVAAMARGVRLGWLEQDRFTPVLARAWSAVLARVAEDGTLRDVCTSTGAQATLEYYMNRPVVNGADDRGGAVVLLAALEMEELERKKRQDERSRLR
ncbi:MAG: glycoside hydrolase family 88 protein [Longimicrobiales bacterium]